MSIIRSKTEVLQAARRVADLASTRGVSAPEIGRRPAYAHVGALLADAVLQAGLNYRSVVLPRVTRILASFPADNKVSSLKKLVSDDKVSFFLNWSNSVKIRRFENIVLLLDSYLIEDVQDIHEMIGAADFCRSLMAVNGVGPKTVDYIACLVGVESIAVDRHIRSFALKAKVHDMDYDFLKNTFSYAADLLSIPRRDFDAWVWSQEANQNSPQLTLAL